jgi:3-oxoacyl-[acyl-carrier protein] reductase
MVIDQYGPRLHRRVAPASPAPKAPTSSPRAPFGRVAAPSEIAAAVLWLASPEAQWACGTVLDLNGASYLRT